MDDLVIARYFVELKATNGPTVALTFNSAWPFALLVNGGYTADGRPRVVASRLTPATTQRVEIPAAELEVFEVILGHSGLGLDLIPRTPFADERSAEPEAEVSASWPDGHVRFVRDVKGPKPPPGQAPSSDGPTTTDSVRAAQPLTLMRGLDLSPSAQPRSRSPVKRALLVGSAYGELKGVARDIERMTEALQARKFEVRQCVGTAATRKGILDAYRQLIADTEANDIVVFYYSGHGGSVENTNFKAGAAGRAGVAFQQFIVPIDFAESSEHEFRGILRAELSAWLGQLTQKTDNVAVILDCCHAGGMSRGPGLNLVARALPPRVYPLLDEHLDALEREGALKTMAVESNRNAVRLIAAAADQSAYEYRNAKGEQLGMLTESFSDLLAQVGDRPISWAALGRRIQERTLAIIPFQRPEIEGPAKRVLFSTFETDQRDVVSYFVDGKVPKLRGGRLLGVGVGDEYDLFPLTGSEAEPALAQARVLAVDAGESRLELINAKVAPEQIPLGSAAVPTKRAFRRFPVLIGSNAEGRGLEPLLDGAKLVRRAHPGEDRILATLVMRAAAPAEHITEALEIRDRPDGPPVLSYPPGGGADAIVDLENLARAQALRELSLDGMDQQLHGALVVDWGQLRAGQPSALPTSGATLHTDDRIFVHLTNRGSAPIYVSVVDVGVGGAITVLNANPSGIKLEPGKDDWIGKHDGIWQPLELGWPERFPSPQPVREESLLFFVTNKPYDVTPLQHPGVYRSKSAELDERLEQIADGRTRDFKKPVVDLRFAMQRLDFFFSIERAAE